MQLLLFELDSNKVQKSTGAGHLDASFDIRSSEKYDGHRGAMKFRAGSVWHDFAFSSTLPIHRRHEIRKFGAHPAIINADNIYVFHVNLSRLKGEALITAQLMSKKCHRLSSKWTVSPQLYLKVLKNVQFVKFRYFLHFDNASALLVFIRFWSQQRLPLNPSPPGPTLLLWAFSCSLGKRT